MVVPGYRTSTGLRSRGRDREACIARIAWEQRQKFGAPTPGFFAHDGRFDQQTLINRFVRSCLGILEPDQGRYRYESDRSRRFRSRCKFETRQSPKSGLWEYRVVGPDPKEFPLDCPPNDEQKRRTQWKAYPDEWSVVWWTTGGKWEPLIRYRLSNQARVHARDVCNLHRCVCIVRDQSGKFSYGCSYDTDSIKRPEDEFEETVV